MTDFTDLGRYHFCDVGRPLYDEWVRVLDDMGIDAFGGEFIRVWDNWTQHRDSCETCGGEFKRG